MQLLLFSAHNKETLEANVHAIQQTIQDHQLVDLAHTLSSRRSLFAERAFLIAAEKGEEISRGTLPYRRARTQSPKIGFIFAGEACKQVVVIISHTSRSRRTMASNGPQSLESIPMLLAGYQTNGLNLEAIKLST